MSIFDQLQKTFANLDHTPDRAPLSLLARAGGSDCLQAWESPSAQRLRQALCLLKADQGDSFRHQVALVLRQIEASAQRLWQPEMAQAIEPFGELYGDMEQAADLLEQLCQTGQDLQSAQTYGEAVEVFGLFMGIFARLDEVEERLLWHLAEAA
ncbi:hypothetical protein IV102_13440 [bacterium]|nr:hypothetical protein [bacterium]